MADILPLHIRRTDECFGQFKITLFGACPFTEGGREQFLVLGKENGIFPVVAVGCGRLYAVRLVNAGSDILVDGKIFSGKIVIIFWILIEETQFSLEEPYSKARRAAVHGQIAVVVGDGDGFWHRIGEREGKEQLLVARNTVHGGVFAGFNGAKRKCALPQFTVGEYRKQFWHIEHVFVIVTAQKR